MKYDIRAEVTNLRESMSAFGNKYRPMFKISNRQNYLTTGEITFSDPNLMLEYNNMEEAYVSFISPEVYPHTLWVGKNLYFYEGNRLTGKAVVLEIYNKILETTENNEEFINIKLL